MGHHTGSASRTEIRLAGSGGQGLILGARILFRALALEGKRVAQSQSYEPTSRGGFCFSDLVMSDESDYPLVTGLDALVALDQVGTDKSIALVKPHALVIVDDHLVTSRPNGDFTIHAFPMTEHAKKIGSGRVANMVGLGALVSISKLCKPASLDAAIKLETPKKFADLNLEAAKIGYALARDFRA